MSNTKIPALLLTALLVSLAYLSLGPSDKGHLVDDSFGQWKLTFQVHYETPDEHVLRQAVFRSNVRRIEEHNARETGSRLGWTQFMDLTPEEFAGKYLRLRGTARSLRVADSEFAPRVSVDWVAAGAVTAVKNQASGSAVALVAAEALEAITKIRDGALRTIDERNLLDCLGQTSFHEYFALVQQNGTARITPGTNYGYVAKTCAGPFRIASDTSVSGCPQLLDNLLKGPVAVAVDAGNWPLYKSGVFENCGSSVNHAVLAVGVTDAYWRLKNSWGVSWGEGGYIRVKAGNTCAVCVFGVRPVG